MKKQILFLVVLLSANGLMYAQDTIAGWTFPSTSADSLVDVSISLNSSRYISAQYGTYNTPTYHAIPIDYSTNGSMGTPDKCGKAIGWDNGKDSANWMVKFKTTNYQNLKLYSKQQSGGNNPGPKDFKVQYKLPGGSSPWVDLTGGTIVCANDWTTGVINGIDIPADCNNQSSQISIRWLQTSNLDINGNTLVSTGLNKIDDIIVTGMVISGIPETSQQMSFNVYPNPNSQKILYVKNSEMIRQLNIYNLHGQLVKSFKNVNQDQPVSLQELNSGLYFIQPVLNDNIFLNPQKLIIE